MSNNDYFSSDRFKSFRDKSNNTNVNSPSFLIRKKQSFSTSYNNATTENVYKKKLSKYRNFLRPLLDLPILLLQISLGILGHVQNFISCLPKITCLELGTELTNNNNNNAAASYKLYQESPLFSSDDEEEEDNEKILAQHKNLIDDHQLPFVYVCDNIFYLLNLCYHNRPAFTHEVKKRAKSLITTESGKGTGFQVYRTCLKKSRPAIFNQAVEILKRREARKRMTKVPFEDHKQTILTWALGSRFVIFLIQMIANLSPEWKHENDGFKFTPEENYGKPLDSFVNATFGGYVNWDAHYFLHISVYGYTSENMIAFFPLLPMILFLPTRLAYFFFGYFISLSSLVVVFGVLFNTWLFVKCTGKIYDLTKLWSNGSVPLISAASLFFIFNPASIFFSGLYTETLFAYLTTSAILSLFQREFWTSMVYAGLSGLCRSNGILNAGFIVAFSLQKQLLNQRVRFSILSFLMSSALQLVVCITPFLLFQTFCVKEFCKNKLYADNLAEIPLYCITQDRLPTLPYSHVQEKYWNVGFLRYFQLKQIPNFILALPVLYFLTRESVNVFKRTVNEMQAQKTFRGLYFAAQALHGLFLAAFCFLFVHVQVSTRMIMAACPYLFVYMSDTFLTNMENYRNRKVDFPVISQLMIIWCAVYFISGAIGFSLGLPWT